MKMMSIYGQGATPTSPPRKHNHFVPDGYIPPKNRQKVIPPPSYARMIRGGGSPNRPGSRQQYRQPATPRNIKSAHPYSPSSTSRYQDQYVLPYAEFSRAPSRPDTPDTAVDRKTTLRKMLQNFDSPRRVRSEHSFPQAPSPTPQPSTTHQKPNSPRGVMKSNSPTGVLKSQSPRGILKSNPLRGILKKSAGSPPTSRPRSPAEGQQYCNVGGDEYTPPPSRQRKAPQSCGLGPSTKRSPPSSDGSQSKFGPISVVDKYDIRDQHVWKPHYSPGRAPLAKSARGRPWVRNPNIIFGHVVNAQDEGGASCSSKQYSNEDDDEEDPDEYDCRKLQHHPCAAPLDWDRDPALRGVECEERQAYRQRKLEDYLQEMCARQKQGDPPEGFESYLIRCYAYANGELNSNNSKHILGYVDGHLSLLDVWVLRLCRGTISRLARMGTAHPHRDNELFLRILREECVALHSERGSLLRRHLNETERRVNACNEQERNYKKILLLSQRTPMGVMQNLRRRDYR